MKNDNEMNQSNIWPCITSIFFEIEFNNFPVLLLTFTLWEVTDPYLVGGMPLVVLVDLLTLGGDSIGLLDSLSSTGTSLTIDFSMDCT